MKLPTIRELRAPFTPVNTVQMLGKAIRLRNEKSLQTWFELLAKIDAFGSSLALDPTCDRIAHGVAMPTGEINTLCIHADHTMTVVAIRNGGLGYGHVLQGLGTALLQAVQVRVSKVAPAGVKAALVFTTTGTIHMDALITQASLDAGVRHVVWPLYETCIGSMRMELDALCAELPASLSSREGVSA